jgi:hypothetical protein
MALTTKIGLTKPAYNDARWDIPISADLDILDTLAGMTPPTVKALTGVAASVDVLVYNTAKDSDGGVWRFRCQNKSWYNETLNTATRGATREFPAVALIVAETNKITIFDATVAGCPMWMVFNGAASRLVINYAPSSICMLNGVLTIGFSIAGLLTVGFLSEISIYYQVSYYGRYLNDIAHRNSSSGFTVHNPVPANIVNINVNDVAMCVIPNAPLDSTTGLPVPTIAAATAGGLSIIAGYAGVGTVVDDVYTPIPAIQNISISGERITFSSNNSFVSANLSAFLADGSFANTAAWTSGRGGYWCYNVNSSTYTIPPCVTSAALEAKCAIASKAFGSTNGLTLIFEDTVIPANGMVAHITKASNTGWMKGDIRRAIACEALGTTVAVGATIPDLSPKATTITKTGTLTYSPVATGAELQAIYGFSASNYLSQAYSADLDFGTGDFFIAGWIKENPNSTAEVIFARDYYNGSSYSGSGILLQVQTPGSIQAILTNNGYSNNYSLLSTAVVDRASPVLFVMQRVGGYMQLWIDAVKDAESAIITATASLSNSSATFRLGASNAGLNPLTNGSLSLFRIGAGSLSAAQIAKMYTDELPMFQANSKCRLQGISNQVNALAYNSKKDTLFVATPNALTEFNGLISKLSDRVTASTAINAVATDSDVVVSSLPTSVYASVQGMNLVERIEANENKPQSKTFGDLIGGNYSEFEYDGTLKFNGSATIWEDENLDPLSLSGGGTAPTAISFSTSAVQIASFVNASTDQVAGIKELPHKWKLGSAIYFHCHWYPTTTNTGVCRFGLEYFFTQEGVAPSFPAIIYAEQAGSGTAWAKKTTAFAAITPPSELGTQFHFRFFRDGSHANDTFTGNAAVGTIGFHYEADTAGSRLVGTK